MAAEQDDDKDERGERRFTNRQLAALLLPSFRENLGGLVRGSALMLLVAAADLAGPQILRRVINVAIGGGSEGELLRLALLFVGLVGVSLALNFGMTLLVARLGLRIVTELKERLFRHILALGFGFFHEYGPGRLLSRVESDTENLKQLFSHAALRVVHSLLIFAGILVLMLREDPGMTLAVTGCLALLAGLTGLFLRLVRRLHRESRRRHADVSALIGELVGAVDVLQHYGYEARARARLGELGARKLKADGTAQVLEHTFWGVFTAFEVLTTAVVVAVGARKILTGQMDAGTLIMFIEYLRQVFAPILALSEFINLVQRAFVSAERVFAILAIEPDEPPGDFEGRPRLDEVPFAEAIRFENVCFGYEAGRDVLHDVSFEIRRGERVAVVGPSGGGKTTLANLLLAFYAPGAGRITVDGVDLRAFRRRAWRRRIGLVLQGVHLFPGSLRENLTVFDASTDERAVLSALELVQARPLVERLPGGLDAKLAERGANLSLGERQLLSFARALVHDPPVLVLDEATASVDPVTERRIQEGLDRMLRGRTAFLIAHRLSTITRADRILVVLDGRVAESGTHAELYARGGHYRGLFDLQFETQATAV